jgi:hypothetical protein
MKYTDFDAAIYKKCSEVKKSGDLRAVATLASSAGVKTIPARRSKLDQMARKIFEMAHSHPELMDKLEAERKKILADRGINIVDDGSVYTESILSDIFSDDSLMDAFSDFSTDSGDVEYLAAIRQYQQEFRMEQEALEAGMITEDRFLERSRTLEERAYGGVEVAVDYDPVTGRFVPYAEREGLLPRRTGLAPPAEPFEQRERRMGVVEVEEVEQTDGMVEEFAFTGTSERPRLSSERFRSSREQTPEIGEGSFPLFRQQSNPVPPPRRDITEMP